MKRIWMLGLAVALCGMLSGCGTETHEQLVADTISRMNLASVDVGNITKGINDAVDDAKKSGKKLDLTDAGKATEKLKESGTKLVEMKQRIELWRAKITEDEKREYAQSQQVNLNKAFSTLLERQDELRKALSAAAAMDAEKTDELRKKIEEAQAPFEQQARTGA